MSDVRRAKTHELKTLPRYFEAAALGDKTFEIREDDRAFRQGDFLTLREWDPEKGHTGRYLDRRVSYVIRGPWTSPGPDGALVIAAGFVVMAIRKLADET